MKQQFLKQFFNPKTIAIIGASNNINKVGNILMKKNEKFKGEIIPINRKAKNIQGIKSYKKITDYKNQIDLVAIATPAKTIPKILKQCIKKKIKNIIILSAGFSEIGNKKLENKIIHLKNKYKLNILGPNCFGIANPKKNLDLTFSNYSPKKGNTAFISQSGALGSYIIDHKIKLSAFISLGNMIDLNFTNWIEYFNNDKSTKKIICYIEQLKQGRKFIELCKNSKKEIIVVKSGKTKKGKTATVSHTGSLATDEKIYKAAFKQAKIKEQQTLAKAFKLKEEKLQKYLKGKKTLIITNAGGAGALLTDKLIGLGHEVYGPKDLLGTASGNDYKRTLHNIQKDYDQIIIILTPQKMSEPEKTAIAIIESKFKNKILAIFLGKKSMQKANTILMENKVEFLNQVL
jgi:acyl-CoA synthetase (NDP forming)